MLIEFEVPPPRQHEFADRLRTYIAQSLPAVDGFLSARVQASVDGSTVINYAQWTSRAAWEKATGLSAAETGPRTDRNWAESRRDQWFDEAHQSGRRTAHRGRRLDPERHGVRPLRPGGVRSRRGMIRAAVICPAPRAAHVTRATIIPAAPTVARCQRERNTVAAEAST